MALLPGKRPKHEKISDPAAYAARDGKGAFQVTAQWNPWGDAAAHYTTTSHFGQTGRTKWHNNCGPTAVSNLLCMYRAKYLGQKSGTELARAMYADTARYGTSRLYFINSTSPFHGTSDFRAGGFILHSFQRLLGVTPKIRPRRLTPENAIASLEAGAALYLMLLHHPEYGSHHLIGYGMKKLERPSTGEVRYFLQVADGHAAMPRYLDMADFEKTLSIYYEVIFPV